jgi:signal transduction histidine kinase
MGSSIRSRLILVLAFVESVTLGMTLVLYLGAGRLDDGARRTREANDEVRDLLAFALLAHRYMDAFGDSLGQRTLIANHERRAAANAFEARIGQIGPASSRTSQLRVEQWNELRTIGADLDAELKIADGLREKGRFSEAEHTFALARHELFDQRMLPWFTRTIDTLRREVSEREAVAMREAQNLRIGASLFGCASVVVALVAVLAISRTVLRPVKLLVQGAEALGAGDLSFRVVYDEENELGMLANRFNAMADTVARAQSALLERNARLEEAYQVQAEFLSMVSHELRSPLHSIVGYTELLLEDETELGEQSRKNIVNMATGANRLLSLINDILDFSKLKAGRMEVHAQELDLKALLEGVHEDARALVRGRPVEVVLEAPSERILMASDESKLRQILGNLVANAIKFTERGQVTLRAVPVEGGVEFRIADTGIGISPENLGIIFEPFRQVKGAGKRGGGGTGLGLAIVARLTTLLGGRISVESEVGKGSRFTVVLPA